MGDIGRNAIAQVIGENVAERRAAGLECIDGRIGVVEGVDIAAVSADFQAAVETGQGRSVTAGGAGRNDAHGAASGLGSGTDSRNAQLRVGVVGVAVLAACAGFDVACDRNRILLNAVGVINGYWRVVVGGDVE